DRLLSEDFVKSYSTFRESVVPPAEESGRSSRLEEANNFFNGGLSGASDSFAAALWGLDFMHWWAAHGLTGINFHTVGGRYSPYVRADDGYEVRPLGYGMKAFDLGCHGAVLPLDITNSESVNLT